MNIGVTDETPFTQRKYIQVSNMICIAVSALEISLTPMALSSGGIILIFHISLPILLVMCLTLNHFMYHSISRNLISMFSIAFIFFMYFMLGNQVMTYLYFFTVVSILPMIFPPEQTKALVFYEMVTFIIFTFEYFFIDNVLPLYVFKNETEEMLPILIPILTLFFSIVTMVLFRIIVIKGDELFESENEKAEQLLLNILPEQIANRLKLGESNIVDNYANVSVMFIDIVGFTPLAQSISPSELVEMLNKLFSRIDGFAENYNVEKIKTIGDAYIIASGIPKEDKSHAENLANLALDIIKWMTESEFDLMDISIRVGINSGPVVAGVFGSKKYIYDLWGDTVSLAWQLESLGESNRIQISEQTYQMIKHQFNTEYRGLVNVNDKGEQKAWWLNSKKTTDQ